MQNDVMSWALAEIGAALKDLNDAEVMVLMTFPKIVWSLHKNRPMADYTRLPNSTK